MTYKLSLQIALITIVASCLAMVLIVIGGSFAGTGAVDLGQVVPLAIACAAAFVVMLTNPFERSLR